MKPWIINSNGNKIYGKDIINYHKNNKSSSYHCTECGGPINPKDDYPCPHCKFSPKNNKCS